MVEGVNFNSGNAKLNCFHDGRWQIAWRTEVVEQERVDLKFI